MAIKVTEIKHNYMYSHYFLPLTFSYFISSPKTNSQRLTSNEKVLMTITLDIWVQIQMNFLLNMYLPVNIWIFLQNISFQSFN